MESLKTRFAILLSQESDYNPEVEDVGNNFYAFVQFKFCEFLDPTASKKWGFVSDWMKSNFVEFAMEVNETFELDFLKLIP